MSLERKDIRAKLDPDLHAALKAICDELGLPAEQRVRRRVVQEVPRAEHVAQVLRQLGGRGGKDRRRNFRHGAIDRPRKGRIGQRVNGERVRAAARVAHLNLRLSRCDELFRPSVRFQFPALKPFRIARDAGDHVLKFPGLAQNRVERGVVEAFSQPLRSGVRAVDVTQNGAMLLGTLPGRFEHFGLRFGLVFLGACPRFIAFKS